MECIFCKIVKKEIPAEIVFEDDRIIAFKDLRPIAPVHILVIPKKHIESIADLTDKDSDLAGKIIMAGKKIAEKLQISEKGYKMLFRVKEWGGQEVPHMHLHVIGGAKLSENIHPILEE